MSGDAREDGILSRWSRRKLSREEEEEETSFSADEAKPADDGESELSEEELARQAQLEENRLAAEAVDLATLDEKSDFSVFMKEGVPTLLRKKAMAALWRSSPVFANVDGLVDYGEDFASPELTMKTFQSAYQAGRGYLKVLEEQAKTAEMKAKLSAGIKPDEEEINEAETGEADTKQAHASGESSRPEEEKNEASGVSEPGDAPPEASDSSSEKVDYETQAPDAFEGKPRNGSLDVAEQKPGTRVSLRQRLALDENGNG